MDLEKRLSQLRRQQKLSQEQLAEQLGVSRQAVSKWESGAATPELEKLIALCKLYGLSLDQLLGLPSQESEPQEPAALSPELLETLLEERRLWQKQEQKCRIWLPVGGACFLAVLVLALGFPLLSLLGQVSALEKRITGVQAEVDLLGENLGGSVPLPPADPADSLAADYSVRLISENIQEETLTLSVSVTPKSWNQQLKAEFEGAGRNFAPVLVSGAPAGAGTFSALLSVPMDEEIKISVALLEEGQDKKIQLLETLYGYEKERYQLQPSGEFFGQMGIGSGSFWWEGDLRLEVNQVLSQIGLEEKRLVFPVSAKWTLLRNGEQADTGVFSLPQGDLPGSAGLEAAEAQRERITYESPFSHSLSCEPGDELELVLETEDNLGRSYQVTAAGFLVGEGGEITKNLLKP